jgi:hypothetical protein
MENSSPTGVPYVYFLNRISTRLQLHPQVMVAIDRPRCQFQSWVRVRLQLNLTVCALWDAKRDPLFGGRNSRRDPMFRGHNSVQNPE